MPESAEKTNVRRVIRLVVAALVAGAVLLGAVGTATGAIPGTFVSEVVIPNPGTGP